MPVSRKRCTKCGEEKPAKNFSNNKGVKHGLASWCKNCTTKQNVLNFNKKRKENPAFRLWASSKSSSRTKDREHSLTVEDIRSLLVSTCPYFGIKLFYGVNPRGKIPFNAATIDRIDSTKGYIPGNVRIISWGANRLKSNLTDKQLLTLAKNILRLHS